MDRVSVRVMMSHFENILKTYQNGDGNDTSNISNKTSTHETLVSQEEDICHNDDERDCMAREYLKSEIHTQRESNVDLSMVPKHIAVIMDGNRRYGREKYGNTTQGHWDGSRTLVDFSKWCLAEGIKIITVYAFSTENWNRSTVEINALMKIFCRYCDELRVEALDRNIRLNVFSTETENVSCVIPQI